MPRISRDKELLLKDGLFRCGNHGKMQVWRIVTKNGRGLFRYGSCFREIQPARVGETREYIANNLHSHESRPREQRGTRRAKWRETADSRGRESPIRLSKGWANCAYLSSNSATCRRLLQGNRRVCRKHEQSDPKPMPTHLLQCLVAFAWNQL
jgi:hypothetical protein